MTDIDRFDRRAKIIIVWLAIAMCVSGCWKKEVVAPPPVPTTIPEPIPTENEALTAVARYFPHSKRVCYDPAWGYFLDYGHSLMAKEEDDGMMHGNYLVRDVKFHKSSNGTFFIDNIPDEGLIPVSPDLNNLTCKTP